MLDVLYIVVPCYNEEQIIRDSAVKLRAKLEDLIATGTIADKSRILFVNDGSKDDTWKIISELCTGSELINGISLAHNKGHQNALLAGLMVAKENADIVISLDADLQDDIDAIDPMIEKYHEGCDIVYGVRNKREKDSFFKRFTAESFYKVMNLMGAETIYNHADYRLMSKRALDGLAQYREVNLFLRGIVPMLGYKTDCVYYERGERLAGESKYPLKKMIAFAMEGITSLSNKPIRYVLLLGALCALLGVGMAVYVIVSLVGGHATAGWASIMMSIWLLGGLLLMALGLIGEYVGKIYMETKRRPKFILEEHLK